MQISRMFRRSGCEASRLPRKDRVLFKRVRPGVSHTGSNLRGRREPVSYASDADFREAQQRWLIYLALLTWGR